MEPIVLDDVFINEDGLLMGEMNEDERLERFETLPRT
jgi:hypothetical protein